MDIAQTIVLLDVATQIMDGIDPNTVSLSFDGSLLLDEVGQAELFSVLVGAVKLRYDTCLDDAGQSNECKYFNELFICLYQDVDFISETLAAMLFQLAATKDFRSIAYRQVFVEVCNALSFCQHTILKGYVYSYLLNSLIQFHLYADEPYKSCLPMILDYMRTFNAEQLKQCRLTFLE